MTSQPKIEKAKGVTSSERYLNRLAENTFLSLWSYPGVFRDQTNGAKSNEGKEVCDLLVIFGNHLIIFSDKDIEFPNIGNLETDWSRWYKRAIEKSANQIYGAERWIREHPSRLFLDKECNNPFPIPLPSNDEIVIHRIVVAHGAKIRCQQYFGGGTGSLMIWNDLKEKELYKTPFITGIINSKKGYVHIFDDVTLDIVMGHLDTVTDFVEYLTKKEDLILNKSVTVSGEEDLLAVYLQTTDENKKHIFLQDEKYDTLITEEGLWSEFLQSDLYQSQKKANAISYAWDSLILKFNKHLMEGTRDYTSTSDIKTSEIAHRFLARERRTRRRILADHLLDMYNNTPHGMRRNSVIFPEDVGDPYYVFLILSELDSINYEEYRETRRNLLGRCCQVAKLECPDMEDCIGIAMSARQDADNSEDLAYFDFREWSEDEQAEIIVLREELELFQHIEWHRSKHFEYPSEKDKRQSDKPQRNAPCPCGSGKKYKKCCMKRDRMVAQKIRQQKKNST